MAWSRKRTDARASVSILPILQALADQDWMGEDHYRSQDQLCRCARIDRLKFAGLDPVAQDQLHDVAESVLVGPIWSQLSSIATSTMSLTRCSVSKFSLW